MMKSIKKLRKVYLCCIDTFGFVNGNKMFLALSERVLNVSRKKTPITVRVPRLGGASIVLRRNSTDLILAYSLFMKDGEYDFLFQKPYVDILQNAKVVFDVGANIGLFSLICNSINPNTKFICIEPENNNYNILKKNMQSINSVCMKKGLWNKETSLKVVPRNTGEWGYIVEEVSDGNENTIEAISIYDILNANTIEVIDILKIDIEGAEFQVFDHTSEMWIDRVNCLIIEFHDRIRNGCSERVISRMIKHGFKYEVYGENYVFLR